MKVKGIMSVVLLLFVAASVVYLIAGESWSRREPSQDSRSATTAKATVKQAQAESAKVAKEPAKVVEEPGKVSEEMTEVAGQTTEVSEQAAGVSHKPSEPQHKVIAYYFHRTQRCRTCLTMEAYARDALQSDLPDGLESGELEWYAVNVEEPQNEHFVEEYALTASALVLVLSENGEQQQWKNLERVWELVDDEWEFKDYVRDETLSYLESGS